MLQKNKGREELQMRLEKLHQVRLFCLTFHSVCSSILILNTQSYSRKNILSLFLYFGLHLFLPIESQFHNHSFTL